MNESASCKKCNTNTIYVSSYDEDRNPIAARVCLRCKRPVVTITLVQNRTEPLKVAS